MIKNIRMVGITTYYAIDTIDGRKLSLMVIYDSKFDRTTYSLIDLSKNIVSEDEELLKAIKERLYDTRKS